MTWSLVARDPQSGAFGVIIATKFFAVGALCPYAMSGVGALSTQALVNPTYGPRGMRLLGQGMAAGDVVRALIVDDEGRDHRQVHVLDAAGRNAAHTGAACVEWCGHQLGEGFSVAGNMLAGPAVVADTFATYGANGGLPFAERLLKAMAAGEAAGGDKRGKQSAAMIIFSTEDYPELDIRVDDHAEPLTELARLHRESQNVFGVFRQFLPTRANPSGTFDRAAINAAIERRAKEGRSGA
ncbi:MAG TPA: DUF1028 domain-containing protein [Candidatus Cybelea sp.]|nr:DUF1028 domain-containing protein [Candidatus Cybelea sp.]